MLYHAKKQPLIHKALAYLAEKNRDVFWIRSQDYKQQIYVSPVYEIVWQRSLKELYKHPERWGDALHPEDRIRMEEAMKTRSIEVMSENELHENYRIIRPSGEIRWIRDVSYPVIEEGELIAFAGIAQDITEDKIYAENLKQAKIAAEAASKAKSVFVANMSHDLRTPLGAISQLANIAADRIEDKDTKKMVKMIYESGQRVLDLANEVLEISSLDLGETSLYREENFSPLNVVNMVVETVRPAAFNKSLSLSVKAASAVPETVRGFDILIHRILLNLTSNAVKFTDEGSVTIRVNYDSEASNLIIKVIDTGIGIEKNQYQKIFEIFQRLTPTYQNLYRGRGLGLYLVKQFIDYMCGDVSLESTVGKGTTFTCTIPVNHATGQVSLHARKAYLYEGAQIDLTETSGKLSEKNQLKARAETTVAKDQIQLLLVEDDMMAQMVAENILKNLNCAVTIAEDSKQALKAVNKQTFDFIFMDIGLPDQDGIYIAKMIRQTVGSNQHVPIVALTAHANEQVKKDCIKVGMNSVIYKPLNKEKAETALQQFVIGEKIAENSTVAGDCIIDLDSAAQMMNGKESAIELFIKFGESLIPDKAEMEQTFANRDWPGMRKVLHRLKGGLCYCKAPSLSRARTRFHEAVKASENPKIEDLQPLYKKMMQELDVLMQEIKRRFK